MKIVHRVKNAGREAALEEAEYLQKDLDKVAIIHSNFDVIVVEEHDCAVCNPSDRSHLTE